MGGAVAVHLSAQRLLPCLVGVVVVDVVEGIQGLFHRRISKQDVKQNFRGTKYSNFVLINNSALDWIQCKTMLQLHVPAKPPFPDLFLAGLKKYCAQDVPVVRRF